MEYRCLTGRCSGLANSLQSEVAVGPPVTDQSVKPKAAHLGSRTYTGIWDTGATACVVSQKVVTECGLVPIRVVQVHHAQGKSLAPVYLASLFLPNRVAYLVVNVTRGDLSGCDVLIGMDVIGTGDFAVSLDQGKTVFSFRIPSGGPIDFTASTPLTRGGSKPGRNDPCPCGSGRKYKKCHGRKS